MGSDPSLTPELVQAQAFTSGFRGYDQSEVRAFLGRVANELKELRDRIANIESAWHSAEERAARPPVLDEDTLMAAVGEETAAILRAARAAAADLRSRAADEAEKVIAAAQERGAAIRAEAEGVLAREKQAAEEAAGRVVSSAKSEAAQMIDKARMEADSIRASAQQEKMLTIEGASTTRQRILDDLSRRRRVASVQIEQLRAGRERLLESYGVVRRTLEEVQNELTRADTEARAAADDAGRRMNRELQIEDAVDAGEAGEAPIDAEDPLPEGVPVDSTDQVTEPVEAPSTPPASSPVARANGRGGSAATVEALAPTEVEHAPPAPTDPAAVPHLRVVPDEEAPGGRVEKLFQRIRASRSESTDQAAVADEPSEPPTVARSDADEYLLQRRESVITDLEMSLTRKLKRALQDEQNDLLDRLRSLKVAPTASRLLPNLDEQISRYASAAQPSVDKAAVAGVAFAIETLKSKGRANASAPVVADLAKEAAADIVDSLRRRLEQALSAAEGEEQAVLVEALGNTYREWKTQRIERIAGDVLAAAFSRGTWHEVPDGTLLRWVVEDVGGPCPDCDDDALAGTLAKGEVFPTGQPHPPAHTGCRCLLVPVKG